MIADKAFNERGAYFNDVFDVDEIWIVFDTEKELHPCLNDNWEITKSLRKRCKLSNVRLFKDSLVKIIGDFFDCYDLIINLFGGQCQII